MYMECLKCYELMDELEEERADYTQEYFQCPTCKCKVAKTNGADYPDEDLDVDEDDDRFERPDPSCMTCGLTICNCGDDPYD